MCFKKLYELLNGPEYKCILSAVAAGASYTAHFDVLHFRS